MKDCKLARKDRHVDDEARRNYNKKQATLKQVVVEEKQKCWQEFTSNLSVRTKPAEVWRQLHAMDRGVERKDTAVRVDEKLLVSEKERADAIIKHFAAVSRLKQDCRDRTVKKANRIRMKAECKDCNNQRSEHCQPFSHQEMDNALKLYH